MPRLLSRIARLVAPISLLVAASTGCTSVPAGFASPLSVDPGGVQIAMIVPSDLMVKKGDAVFSISWKPDDGPEQAGEYLLDVSAAQVVPGLPKSPASDQRIRLVSFAPADAAAYRAIRRKILDDKAAGRKGKGSISVQFRHACWSGTFPQDNEALPVTVYIRSSAGEAFAPLGPAADLRQLARPRDGMIIPSCSS